ncbi:MAG TPA: ABC transporter permease [Bryobacteraceae bacterium]|nr:ABC transporter permease [Bryobacteraceae bacterium]
MFDDLGVVNTGRGLVARDDESLEQVRLAAVSPNFFRMLGAHIILGRDFTEADGQPQAAGQSLPQTAVVSCEYWQRRFGASPAVLVRQIHGPGRADIQIVGVLAPCFELLFPPDAEVETQPDIWTAARLAYDNANRNQVAWRVIGRLKPGVTRERVQKAVDRVAAELRRNFVIRETAGSYIRLEPMRFDRGSLRLLQIPMRAYGACSRYFRTNNTVAAN